MNTRDTSGKITGRTKMLIRLNGISFVDMPHIRNRSRDEAGQLVKGEEVVIVREEGEPWDSEARPAYSVRLDGCHLGYIPLVETLKEEALRAREGYKKQWKGQFATMSKDELREYMRRINEGEEAVDLHEFVFVGKDELRGLALAKMKESENCEVVRDWLYTEIMRNHLTPTGRAMAVYWDADEGRNTVEIGDVCSVSVEIDEIW